ncbi:MAG: MlaD family protein [Opitutales bacterium]
MQRNYQYVGVGLFFLFGLALLWSVFETLGQGSVETETGFEVTARFADLKAVKIGDPVQVAGLRVGLVRDAQLVDNRAEVTFLLEQGISVPVDSVAMIRASGVLGSSYVDIVPGASSQALSHGDTVETVERPGLNDVAPVVSELAEELTRTLRGLEGSEAGGAGSALGAGLSDGIRALGTLGAVLDENRANLKAISTNLSAVTGQLARGEGTLGKLLAEEAAYDELRALLAEAHRAVATFGRLGSEAEGLLADLQAGQGAAGLLLADAATEAQVKAILANVQAFSEALNAEDSTVGRLLRDDRLYRQLEAAIEGVQEAVGALDETGPASAAGVVGGALF